MNLKQIKYERRLTVPDKEEHYSRATTDETGKRFIEGYATIFSQESRIIYERGRVFKEIISRGAFDNVLKSNPNVLATINHDPNQAVARTKNGSLVLTTDNVGLKYRFEVPNTQAGNDLYTMVQNGFYSESSFVFGVNAEGEQWKRGEDGLIHIVTDVKTLKDISVVTDGCYANTDVEVSERVSKRALEVYSGDTLIMSGETSTEQGGDVPEITESDVAALMDDSDEPIEPVEGLELTILQLKLS